ncbi:MAG: histidine triad (HIT) family protein [Kiritimatiellia bacterium]|jgi:histidine triad (HIT) family protein
MTIFQRILDREIPADIVYEDEHVLAFRDVNPQAPVHVLVIPKIAVDMVQNATDDQAELLGRVLLGAASVARSLGVEEGGYRLVINNGAGAGQSVFHLHCHLLAGRPMTWPPG